MATTFGRPLSLLLFLLLAVGFIAIGESLPGFNYVNLCVLAQLPMLCVPAYFIERKLTLLRKFYTYSFYFMMKVELRIKVLGFNGL